MLETADLVQDAVINTLPHLGGLEIRSERAFEFYLKRAIKNRIIDLVRRKKAVSLDRDSDADDGVAKGLANLLRSSDAGPEADYARRLLIAELEDAIAELPPNQRAVFLAHEFEFVVPGPRKPHSMAMFECALPPKTCSASVWFTPRAPFLRKR